ncbi:MAG: electron transport complex subunit RsxC [Chromatiales bacterium]|nr:electron transport complex subunit RsxC [Chromatiales bacterium]
MTTHAFPGGLHLAPHKQESLTGPIRPALIPSHLVLPLKQHNGAASVPCVSVGEQVLGGQMIAAPGLARGIGLHAPTSGTIVEIGERPVVHAVLRYARAIVIEPDGEDRWAEPGAWSPADGAEALRAAGLAGLGGAAFPTADKLAAGAVHTLIINGAECEPYITCDEALLRERADRVVRGAKHLANLSGAKSVQFAVEDNMPGAITALDQALRTAADARMRMVVVPTIYPTGSERQLVQVLTGMPVPRGKRAIDLGIVCVNVGTAAAVTAVFDDGRPLVSRVATITGPAVAEPHNREVLIGTPIGELLEAAGGAGSSLSCLLLGGPMMGVRVRDIDAPVPKAGNCVLALDLVCDRNAIGAQPCIRCGACVEVCPELLLPQEILWAAGTGDAERPAHNGLEVCIECGCCEVVCPSHIPLVQRFREAKFALREFRQEQARARRAKDRHAARVTRLERREAEKAAKRAAKRAALAARNAPATGQPADGADKSV